MSYIGANQIYNIPPVFKFRSRMMGGRGLANKSLFATFDEEDDTPSDDAIKVFLRLKPGNGSDENIIEVLDSKTVLFKMPREFAQAQKKLNIPAQVKYTFSKIFQTNVTQADIFNGCVHNHIKDLFAGGHCLLFTYGTTNAGKTFTVLGTGNQPGIIPRTLTTVFKSIKGKEYGSARIMPHMFNSAIEVGDSVFEEERLFKKKILTWSHEKSQFESSKIGKSYASSVQTSTDEIIGESVFREMQRRLTNDTDIIDYDAEPDERFSVWVSFAEIYNESIYDLLQPLTLNCKRKPLKLAQDSNNRNTYIKGLKHIFVQSEEEAYQVLMFGKNNLQVAATGMNSRSSRSHCIFSIKLIKCPNVERPEKVLVSSFSICDLAGAERQKKALNVGLRLKESQNINCSLHVLSRCFSIIRDNQLNNENKLIPFRDSKLTQLFQHALLGKESVTMIVNVNSDHHLCEETQHVLKASAIAKHIVVQPRPVTRPQRTTRQSIFSQIISKHNRSTLIRWDSCVKPKVPGESSLVIIEDSLPTQEPSEQEKNQEKYENCLALVEDLKEKLKEEKTKHNETKRYWKQRELEIREEIKSELEAYVVKFKKQNEVDLKRARSVTEDIEFLNGERLIGPKDTTFKKPKIIKNEFEDDVFEPHLNELLEENKMQQKHIERLTDFINTQLEEKKEVTMNLTSVKLQLGCKDKEIQCLKNKIEMFSEECELRTAYLELEKEMESKLKGRDVLLEEARDDLLAEIRMKEDLEEEAAKLEAELLEKEEKLMTLQSEAEDMKQEVATKSSALETLQQQLEEMQSNFDEDINNLELHTTRLEVELKKKVEEIENLKTKSESHHFNNTLVKNPKLHEKMEALELQLESLKIENSEITNKYNDVINSKELETLKSNQDFREEMSEKINDLKNEHESKVTSLENIIKNLELKVTEDLEKITLLERELKKQEENVVAVIIKTSDEYDEKIKLMGEDFNVKLKEKENIILEMKKELSSMFNQQQQLKEKNIKIEELEKSIKSKQIDIDRIVNDQNLEITLLQNNLKIQIQETARLMEENTDLTKKINHLNIKLTESKLAIEELQESLKNKEHELECRKSEITGYLSSIPTLKAEFEHQRSEYLSCKKKCEDYQAAIYNKEQEIDSFKSNQKEIIGKYEEQLKKAKEENENSKKEVARLATTFYKTTPTPKKDLEKQLEDLKKQLEETQQTCQKLKEEKDCLLSKRLDEKENINEHEENVIASGKIHSMTGCRPRILSDDEIVAKNGRKCNKDNEAKTSKSGQKVNTRRTRAAKAVIETSDCENDIKPNNENSQKRSRKKLYAADVLDVTAQFEDDRVEIIPQESPETNNRRALRNRPKY